MIRRLIGLLRAMVERSKLIQDLVERGWLRTTATATAGASVSVPVSTPSPVAAAPAVVAAAPAAPPAATVSGALRPLGAKEAMDGSVWVARILWALEYAARESLGPQSASDISRLLGKHGGLNVPSTNVARAFRERKQDQVVYWKDVGEQRYEISDAGRAALRAQLAS